MGSRSHTPEEEEERAPRTTHQKNKGESSRHHIPEDRQCVTPANGAEPQDLDIFVWNRDVEHLSTV